MERFRWKTLSPSSAFPPSFLFFFLSAIVVFVVRRDYLDDERVEMLLFGFYSSITTLTTTEWRTHQ